jgi:hypothetical protein
VEAQRRTEILRRWLLALGCYALLVFFFSPSWAAFSLWARVPELGGMLEVRRGVSVLAQAAHPGAPIPDPLHAAIQWRLLFPVLGHVLHLPAAALFGLSHVGCLATFAFAITVLRRSGIGFPATASATLIVGAAGWFFASTGWLGYYDAWVVLALLVVAFGESRWSLVAACLWAPWIDERFVIALPLALLCRYIGGEPTATRFKQDALIALALGAAFVAVRLGWLGTHSPEGARVTGYLANLNFTDVSAGRIALGLWEGLRAGWFLVGAAVLGLWATRRSEAVALAALTLVVAVIGVMTAQDFSRSLMFVAPAALLGATLLLRKAGPSLRPLYLGASAATLLLPAHHVMSDRVNPIYYVYHEIAAFENPPAAAMSEMFELRAIRAMQDGNFAKAEDDLGLALKLARNPAAAAKQRGVLRASQGRWKEADEDFALMAAHEPQNPDAWFMRAQASLALGAADDARQKLQHAIELAPADWITRPDVARFRAKLTGSAR